MRARLRQAITVGLSLAGCSDRAVSDDGSGADDESTGATTTNDTASSGPSTTSSTGGGVTSIAPESSGGESEVDSGDDDTPTFDVGGVDPDTGEMPSPVCDGPMPPASACATGPTPEHPQWVTSCVPAGADGQCPAPDAPEVGAALDMCTWDSHARECGSGVDDACGSTSMLGDTCCYWAPYDGPQCPGRPFHVDGHDRVATLALREDWCAPQRELEHDPALAEAWLFDARHEHAAIASFARFAMQLLALAAPPRFVAGAVQAANDEREHALLFFGLARATGGTAIGPGSLDVAGSLARADDPIHVVTATVREGCIAETISALQLQRALETATDPELRAALARVLDEELRHVELAWSFVAWAWAKGGERLRSAVRLAFADADRCIPRGPDVEPAPHRAAAWRASGRLTRADAHRVALDAIRRIIVPAACELFARAPEPQPALAL